MNKEEFSSNAKKVVALNRGYKLSSTAYYAEVSIESSSVKVWGSGPQETEKDAVDMAYTFVLSQKELT